MVGWLVVRQSLSMPRAPRQVLAGVVYHVVNRGSQRRTVFRDGRDYADFLSLLATARRRFAVDVLAFVLMPNHVHLVLRPRSDDGLGRLMHWLTTTQVRRHHGRHGSVGRLWQGRYRSFPIHDDAHLTAVLRYVEANPLRARLVHRAEDWPWGSLAWRATPARGDLLDPPPFPLPSDWLALVNEALPSGVIGSIRRCTRLAASFGGAEPRGGGQQALQSGADVDG